MADPLADVPSGDPQRIWQASWDIIGTRDKDALEHLRLALPAIERATANIELGGMISPNRDALIHALDKVQNYRAWTCWCDSYRRLLAFDPTREEERGHVRILSQDRSGWPVICECECTVCGKEFRVDEGEHHARWWQWTPR